MVALARKVEFPLMLGFLPIFLLQQNKAKPMALKRLKIVTFVSVSISKDFLLQKPSIFGFL